jgi:hypothetical protein
MIYKIASSRWRNGAALKRPCPCQLRARSRARLAGYLDANGNFQDGPNPDPSYGATLTSPPDAVLGPIDAGGQYASVYGAQPNATTPLFPQAPSSPAAPWSGTAWAIVAAVGALAVFSVFDAPKGRRR